MEEAGGGQPLPPHPFVAPKAPRVYGTGCLKCGKSEEHPTHIVESPERIKTNRIRPRAITRMYDFLDLLEELKPGDSGIEPRSGK